jgi:tRNA nucleotidyltransferase (CCA-adding enzyme)
MARARSERVKKYISTFFTKLRGTEIHLTGRDLIPMGFKPGPLFKQIFETVLAAKLRGEIFTKEDEIEFVRKKFRSLLPG